MAGSDLHLLEVDPGVEHRGDEGVPQRVRVHARQRDARLFGEAPQPPGGAVPVHPGAATGQENRSRRSLIHGPLKWRGRRLGPANEDDLVALPADLQYPVAVLFAEVLDVASGLEDLQAEEFEHVASAKSHRWPSAWRQ